MLYNFRKNKVYHHAPNCIELELYNAEMFLCYSSPCHALSVTVEGKLPLVPVFVMTVPFFPKQRLDILSWYFHPVSSCVHVSGVVVLVMCRTKKWEPDCFLKCHDRFQNTGDKLDDEFCLFKLRVCISLPCRKQVVFCSHLYTEFSHAGDCMETLCGFWC